MAKKSSWPYLGTAFPVLKHVEEMAFILKNSLPAMHVGNQFFATFATFYDCWRAIDDQKNPTTILTNEEAA